MNTTSRNFLAFAILSAIVLLFFAVQECKREKQPLGKTEQLPAEPIRQRVVSGRDKMNAELAIDTLKYLTQLEAHSATINRLMANGKQKDKELAALYAKYRKTPTLGNCDTIVWEQSGRIDSLKAEVAARREDSLSKVVMLKTYAAHLLDKDLRIDTLNAISKAANKALSKEKGKRFGLGAQVGYGASKQGLSPYVGVGVNYNLIKF